MRRITMLVATMAAALGVVGVAFAVDVNQGLETKTTGSKGTKAKPKAIKLSVTTTTSGNGATQDGTYATKSAVIHLDKNLKFNPKSFPICTPEVVASTPANCPKGSLVGKGSANATVGAPNAQGESAKVTPTITAYNGAGSTLILQLTRKPGELDSTGQLVGKLQKDNGKYGQKLNVPIPAKLQNQLGLPITLTRFNTVISAHVKKSGKTVSYIESVGCTGGKYSFGGDFVFSDDTKKSVTSTSTC